MAAARRAFAALHRRPGLARGLHSGAPQGCQRNDLLAALASMAAYDCEAVAPLLRKHAEKAKKSLATTGFELAAMFQVVGGRTMDIAGEREVIDTDAAYLWLRADDGHGILAFRGCDTLEDIQHVHAASAASVSGYQLHAQVAESELFPLVSKMKAADFSACASLAVAGHSLGGGCASMFAVLANDPADPLALGNGMKMVDELYSFGGTPVFHRDCMAINKRPGTDGSFVGGVFRTVRKVCGQEVQDRAVSSLDDFHHANTSFVSLRFSQQTPEVIDSSQVTHETHKGIPGDKELFPLHSPLNYLKLLRFAQ